MTTRNEKVDTAAAEAPVQGVGCGALVSRDRDLENMARATRMSDAELVAHLRTWAKIYTEGELARWVLGVAAERIEKSKDTQRMDWMADSYGAAGMTQAEAEEEARAYEKAYAAAKKRGLPDRLAVRAAVDVALAMANVQSEPRSQQNNS